MYFGGVPQGSSLGVKLWLMAINDILSTEDHITQAFAKDICVLVTAYAPRNFSELTKPHLEKINKWASDCGLKFSANKCYYTIIKLGKNIRFYPKVKTGDTKIKYKKVIRYLGVHIDRKLTWTAHLDLLRGK